MTRSGKKLFSIVGGFLLLCMLIWAFVCNSSPSERNESIGIVVAMFSSILAIVSPMLCNWFQQPNLTLTLSTPWTDNNVRFWGIQVKNSGGIAGDAAIYCTGFRNGDEGEYQSLARVRLEWPYESSGKVETPTRVIDKDERVDFFSEEGQGKIHLVFHPTSIKKEKSDLPLFLRITAFARGYVSNPLFLKIECKDDRWEVSEVNN